MLPCLLWVYLSFSCSGGVFKHSFLRNAGADSPDTLHGNRAFIKPSTWVAPVGPLVHCLILF